MARSIRLPLLFIWVAAFLFLGVGAVSCGGSAENPKESRQRELPAAEAAQKNSNHDQPVVVADQPVPLKSVQEAPAKAQEPPVIAQPEKPAPVSVAPPQHINQPVVKAVQSPEPQQTTTEKAAEAAIPVQPQFDGVPQEVLEAVFQVRNNIGRGDLRVVDILSIEKDERLTVYYSSPYYNVTWSYEWGGTVQTFIGNLRLRNGVWELRHKKLLKDTAVN